MNSKISVKLKNLEIGGTFPVRVESMLKTPLEDTDGCLLEIRELEDAGCELVRTAITSHLQEDSLRTLVEKTATPIMADIHFDYRLALVSMQAGCASVRVNPGNLGGAANLVEVLKEAQSTGTVIRIGSNGGSLNKRQIEAAGGDKALALALAVEEQLNILTERGFEKIIISAKSSSVPMTIRANEILIKEKKYPFPVHIGITEAGRGDDGIVQSAAGIGAMLANKIGDTLRVSLSAPSPDEVRIGYSILRALELRKKGIKWISCPACGRRRIDVLKLLEIIEPIVKKIKIKDGFTLAVMGCEVNGPQEAKEADLGIAGAPSGFVLFKKGTPLGVFAVEELREQITKAVGEYQEGT